MIEGITVLSQSTEQTVPNLIFGLGVFCIILSIFCVIVTIIGIIIKGYEYIVSGIIFALILGSLSYVCFATYSNREPYTEYKVTISDKVSLTEFISKYEIISKEDKIYTIKLKETQK